MVEDIVQCLNLVVRFLNKEILLIKQNTDHCEDRSTGKEEWALSHLHCELLKALFCSFKPKVHLNTI
jgi:hypothetical protein